MLISGAPRACRGRARGSVPHTRSRTLSAATFEIYVARRAHLRQATCPVGESAAADVLSRREGRGLARRAGAHRAQRPPVPWQLQSGGRVASRCPPPPRAAGHPRAGRALQRRQRVPMRQC
eukprot:scaffold17225_cov59-Phaeocystis_antarctica.AAC.1